MVELLHAVLLSKKGAICSVERLAEDAGRGSARRGTSALACLTGETFQKWYRANIEAQIKCLKDSNWDSALKYPESPPPQPKLSHWWQVSTWLSSLPSGNISGKLRTGWIICQWVMNPVNTRLAGTFQTQLDLSNHCCPHSIAARCSRWLRCVFMFPLLWVRVEFTDLTSARPRLSIHFKDPAPLPALLLPKKDNGSFLFSHLLPSYQQTVQNNSDKTYERCWLDMHAAHCPTWTIAWWREAPGIAQGRGGASQGWGELRVRSWCNINWFFIALQVSGKRGHIILWSQPVSPVHLSAINKD